MYVYAFRSDRIHLLLNYQLIINDLTVAIMSAILYIVNNKYMARYSINNVDITIKKS